MSKTLFRAPMMGLTDKENRPSVDEDKGAVYGVSVCTVGEALGHGCWLDAQFIADLAEQGNALKQGLKARFGHPNMCSSALGTFLGRFKNFKVIGDQVFADLFLSNEAKDTPGGNLHDYVMGMAANEPDMFGTSIVFARKADEAEAVPSVHTTDDGRMLTVIELGKLWACDVVDDPAANPGGLFSKFDSKGEQSAASLATAFLDENPEIFDFLGKSPEVVEMFLKRYEASRDLCNPNQENDMDAEKQTVEEQLEQSAVTDVELGVADADEASVEPVEETVVLEAAIEEAEVEAEVEHESEAPAEEEVVEAEVVDEEEAEPSDVDAFTAMADEHGYEFARANFGKADSVVYEALLADKDKQLASLRQRLEEQANGSPVPFSSAPSMGPGLEKKSFFKAIK